MDRKKLKFLLLGIGIVASMSFLLVVAVNQPGGMAYYLTVSEFVQSPDRSADDFRIAGKVAQTGIPLLIGRDVIHGFRTVFPIPLGQAATFDPEMAREGARIAAREATAFGINWTFGPMVDIARDPRWGRIAEGCGAEDGGACPCGRCCQPIQLLARLAGFRRACSQTHGREPEIVTLKKAGEIKVTPKRPEGPKWPVVQPATPVNIQYRKAKTAQPTALSTILSSKSKSIHSFKPFPL